MITSKSRCKIGYARVSTIGQTLEHQVKTLKEYGCRLIYCEKASGADANRAELQKLIGNLKEGQSIVVTHLDRLARSTFDLFAIVKSITEKKLSFTLWQNHGPIQLPARVGLCLLSLEV